jgi:hypothetical protein
MSNSKISPLSASVQLGKLEKEKSSLENLAYWYEAFGLFLSGFGIGGFIFGIFGFKFLGVLHDKPMDLATFLGGFAGPPFALAGFFYVFTTFAGQRRQTVEMQIQLVNAENQIVSTRVSELLANWSTVLDRVVIRNQSISDTNRRDIRGLELFKIFVARMESISDAKMGTLLHKDFGSALHGYLAHVSLTLTTIALCIGTEAEHHLTALKARLDNEEVRTLELVLKHWCEEEKAVALVLKKYEVELGLSV